MSKAFTKDDAPTEDVGHYRRDLTEGVENYMTSQGFEAFKREHTELQERRREVISLTSADREDRLREMDSRLSVLANALETARVIDPAKQRGDRVLFGATVTVSDEDGVERVYRIVGVDETDPAHGKVSWMSPIAKALLQARAGDTVALKTPHKTEELEVLKIEFKPVP